MGVKSLSTLLHWFKLLHVFIRYFLNCATRNSCHIRYSFCQQDFISVEKIKLWIFSFIIHSLINSSEWPHTRHQDISAVRQWETFPGHPGLLDGCWKCHQGWNWLWSGQEGQDWRSNKKVSRVNFAVICNTLQGCAIYTRELPWEVVVVGFLFKMWEK